MKTTTLKERRKAIGLTMAALGKRIGIDNERSAKTLFTMYESLNYQVGPKLSAERLEKIEAVILAEERVFDKVEAFKAGLTASV